LLWLVNSGLDGNGGFSGSASASGGLGSLTIPSALRGELAVGLMFGVLAGLLHLWAWVAGPHSRRRVP